MVTKPLTAEEIALVRSDITRALTVLGGGREVALRLLATLDAREGLDVERIVEGELDMHNMLDDGRCDCGDHDDWPMTETFNRHVAAFVADHLRKSATLPRLAAPSTEPES